MDVLLIYCETGAPSRYLRCLEAGIYHQVLVDAGYKVTSLLMHSDRRPEDIVTVFQSDPARLVCFYLDEFSPGPSLRLATQLRAAFPDTPICAAGIHPTLAPDQIMTSPAFDYMLVGEAEIALYELVAQLAKRGDVASIKNLWWKREGHVERNPLRPLQDNLDQLPYPDRSLIGQLPSVVAGGMSFLKVSASRGCVYDCQFCYSPVLKNVYGGKGNYYRVRTPQHVAGEILSELRRADYAGITYVDEIFPTEKQWLRSMAQRLGGQSAVQFEATVAVEKCDTETLDLLKAAGCSRLILGVESGNEGFRRRIASRNHGNERIRTFVAAARERGLGIVTTNQIGLPLESEPLVEETYGFAKELAPDEVHCTVYQPIPGTMLYQYATDKNYLPETAGQNAPDFTSLSMQLPELRPETVRNYLYRMHFLNLINRLKGMPRCEGFFDFLAELPRAKFKMRHSAAVDVGRVQAKPHAFGYLSVETGSECRFQVQAPGRTLLKFSIHIPEGSFARLKGSGARVMVEVVWANATEEQGLFSRLIGPAESRLTRKWLECMTPGPEDGGSGEVIFRVSSFPESELKASVFFGMPCLVDLASKGRRRTDGSAGNDSVSADTAEAVKSLRAELDAANATAAVARQERDQKVQRIAELQTKILELEKQLEAQQAIVEQYEAGKGAGISDKLKGMFKK